METTPNLATRAIEIPLSSSYGTTWYLFNLTPSGWCKTDAHSTDFGPRILKDFLKLVDSLDLDGENRERTHLGPHDTQYCIEDPEQAFIEYASSRIDEAGGCLSLKLISNDNKGPEVEIEPYQPEVPKLTLEDEFQDLHLNLPVLKVLAHALIYNDILDKYVENLELGKNGSAFVQGEVPAKMEDPGLFTLPCRLKDSKPFDTLADPGSCVNIISFYLFKKLNIRLLEETDHIFGLVDGTRSYPVGIVKDVEVHIGKQKLLNDFCVIDMKKDPETPLLVGKGFLATANAVIDCRMAKIAVREGITRSVFGVKGVDLGEEEAPYWTTLGKRESYKP
ncbi:reverse transcriptase [Tanacetum coccineum]